MSLVLSLCILISFYARFITPATKVEGDSEGGKNERDREMEREIALETPFSLLSHCLVMPIV